MLDAIPLAGRGFLGVDLFFVISGFLIVTLLLRERENTGTISLKGFYGRRLLRIFPVFYSLLLILTIYFWLAKDSKSAQSFFYELPYHATYTSNLIVATSLMAISWSLAAEEQFYLIWPPVEKFLGNFVVPTLACLIVINQLANFKFLDPLLLRFTGLGHSDLKILQVTFTPICLGVALAHILHSDRGFSAFNWILTCKLTSLLSMILLLAIANISKPDISGVHRLSIQLMMMVLVGACVLTEDHYLKRVLAWRPIKKIGEISYGMYLYHIVAMFIVHKALSWFRLHSPLITFLLVSSLTIGIAQLSFRYFELPILKLKHRFR
jgi:peptidoglycan/LPS O-acetylase OafA/YrhL